MSDWIPNITNWRVFNKEKTQFVFEQVRQCHLNTLENRKLLEQKALTSVGALVTLSTALLGLLVTQCHFDDPSKMAPAEVLWSLLTILLFFLVAMWKIIITLYPVKYYPPGNEPQFLVDQELLEQDEKWLFVSEIVNYQTRITANNLLNDKKAKALEYALFISALAPIASLSIFVWVHFGIFNKVILWIGWFSQLWGIGCF